MKRGRKPKPTPLKILNGNPGKRAIPDEPAALAGMPDPPADLPPKVREVWDRVGPLLGESGVLTRVDGLALMLLCRAAADFIVYSQAAPPGSDVLLSEEELDDDGNVTKSGNPYWNLAASARDKAEARLHRLLVEFGLTPAARSRVTGAGKKESKGGKSRFFNAG